MPSTYTSARRGSISSCTPPVRSGPAAADGGGSHPGPARSGAHHQYGSNRTNPKIEERNGTGRRPTMNGADRPVIVGRPGGGIDGAMPRVGAGAGRREREPPGVRV